MTDAACQPFKPETWPVDADGFAADLCTECGTPVRYGSRHSRCGAALMANGMTEAETSATASVAGFAGDMKCQPEGLKFDAFGEPRTRYVRVSLNRSHCVMEPSEGDCYVQEARDSGDPDWERYIVTDVYLSKREFEDLPDHDGF